MIKQSRGARYRFLWLSVHTDKVLTNGYIVYALTLAPAGLVFTDDRGLHLAIWWSLIVGAIALAVLGIIMAVGMGLIVSHDDSLEFDWFLSHFDRAVAPESGRPMLGG